jgi:hypothetical protein
LILKDSYCAAFCGKVRKGLAGTELEAFKRDSPTDLSTENVNNWKSAGK